MGVYHLMGLGRSVGAVSSPISYLAARYQRDAPEDRAFFRLSGELAQPPEMKRGGLQALVLFTTDEIHAQRVTSLPYELNQSGHARGKRCNGEVVPRLLRRLIQSDLEALTEASRDRVTSMVREEIEVYWCLYEPNRPTQTFERVAAVLNAAKAVSNLGKETWINLTGGTNIVNSALQLAVSLLGVSARLYYTWTQNSDCVYHPVNQSELGDAERDQFWVDLPVVYFGFNEHHRHILDLLNTMGQPLTLYELYGLARGAPQVAAFPDPPGDTQRESLAWFRQTFLLPLRMQRLITLPDDAITLGPTWNRLQRYYEAIPWPRKPGPGLHPLSERETWLFREEWSVH